MIYQLNQTTQLGKISDDMLQKLMDQKEKSEKDNLEDKPSQKVNKQLDQEELVRLEEQKEKNLHEEEYNNLKERDHKLALSILVEERKSLEAQIAEYKLTIKNHETGNSNLSDLEITSVYKIYEHLLLQRKELDQHMLKYDKKAAEQATRDEDKERIIKMLVNKYSDTL